MIFERQSEGSKLTARNVVRMLVNSAVGWTLIAFFMTLARAEDNAARGRVGYFWSDFELAMPYFLPLIALSWALEATLKRWPSLTEQPKKSLLLFASVLLLFFPAYLVYEAMVGLVQSGGPIAKLLPTLKEQSRVGWWTDAMIVTGGVLLHFAFASRARLVERDFALKGQLSDNLQLRLTLLQSQLEPHFLFNALNSISGLVRSGDRTLALEVLERVSELLRYALRASRAGMLTMRDELDFTERYLSVQSLRHGERLQIDCQIGDVNWNAVDCPPLLFQPLIENALRHGVETTPGPHQVVLSVGCKESIVFIEIVNDIDDEAAPLPGNGMGISMVRDRLQALYGGRACLSTERSERKFFARIEFPADNHDG